MKTKHARLTVLLDADRKREFEELCADLGTTASEVLRGLIRGYLAGETPEPHLPDNTSIRRRPKRERRD